MAAFVSRFLRIGNLLKPFHQKSALEDRVYNLWSPLNQSVCPGWRRQLTGCCDLHFLRPHS